MINIHSGILLAPALMLPALEAAPICRHVADLRMYSKHLLNVKPLLYLK